MHRPLSLNNNSSTVQVLMEKTLAGENVPFQLIKLHDTAQAFGGGKNPTLYKPYLNSCLSIPRSRPKPGACTQLESAHRGEITPEMHYVAVTEGTMLNRLREELPRLRNPKLSKKLQAVIDRYPRITPEFVRQEIAARRAVLPLNFLHIHARPMIIGSAFKTKINANIGSSDAVKVKSESEIEKLFEVIKNGADTVMDLSVGEHITEIRKAILNVSPVPVGTVPIYEVLQRAKSIENISWNLFAEVMQEQAEQGVDYMTIHAGILRSHVELTRNRFCGIVSRGGGILAQWMHLKKEENFLFTHFREILEIARHYDLTLSLGDGLRPGSILDGSDAAQLAELKTLGELNREASEFNVQVMIEGPGHIRSSEIESNAFLERSWCNHAPFYTLGPLVTDIGAGNDHITAAIGANAIAASGAAMLCYVTPKEHLGLPDRQDVSEAMAAFKIAAHAADIARGVAGAEILDALMSMARFEFRWDDQYALSLFPEKSRKMRSETLPGSGAEQSHFCSMCGPNFCPMKIARELFK